MRHNERCLLVFEDIHPNRVERLQADNAVSRTDLHAPMHTRQATCESEACEVVKARRDGPPPARFYCMLSIA
ncbi:hypothetical protein CBM2633_P90026 [Cupriavidus taiwanensis]|nr:hypothetical protein CBM2592_P120025 [Cupriavidus taiwanensis]SOZ40840.1 hypothetical protein CBM2605_P90026 [Cupriavidus neocaledonicus]SOY77141.1 hypothetical protein CBM2585_P90026 [Cupriavidus taiwanensis]SOY98952.1 hypothetical protein CBM2591_P120026 [Cupriavidus taiwanensis]SOZ21272.1 hypothetical protein CBM2595_P90026 [Cupriavidus taiwanensis]